MRDAQAAYLLTGQVSHSAFVFLICLTGVVFGCRARLLLGWAWSCTPLPPLPNRSGVRHAPPILRPVQGYSVGQLPRVVVVLPKLVFPPGADLAEAYCLDKYGFSIVRSNPKALAIPFSGPRGQQ